MNTRIKMLTAIVFALAIAQRADAQFVVTDPAVTHQNTVIAFLKTELLETLSLQRDRLRQMAARLSLWTRLDRYGVDDVPLWRTHDGDSDAVRYSAAYQLALNFGDPAGAAFDRIARSRVRPDVAILQALPADTRTTLATALATIDAADSAIVAATHDAGALRFNGRRETNAIAALQQMVIDPSNDQSVTAILEKINGAALLEARQKQARLQLLGALNEQLLLENKRLRDTEVAAINMHIGRLRHAHAAKPPLLSGAANELRGWRQP